MHNQTNQRGQIVSSIDECCNAGERAGLERARGAARYDDLTERKPLAIQQGQTQ